MIKKVKKPQPIITEAKIAKQTFRWKRDFREQFKIKGCRKFPDSALEYLADIMLEWIASSPEITNLKEFLNYQNTLAIDFQPWMARCKKLKDAYKLTLQIIGTNREQLALWRKIDFNTMKMRQYQYDPEWEKAEERQAKLKALVDDNSLKVEDFKAALKDILKPIDDK